MSVLVKFNEKPLVYDFGNTTGKCSNWLLLSDRIMGGRTISTIAYTDNSVVLSGNISLENYGGFAAVRTNFNQVDLSGYKGVKIRFRSTAQKFAFTLEDSRNWTQPNYKGKFTSKKDGVWQEATLFFKDFYEYQIGEPTGRKMPLESLKNIVRLGFMTIDKKEGPFEIEVDYIAFF